MFRRYLNRAVIWDLIIVIIIITSMFYLRPYLSEYVDIPSFSDIEKIQNSLISIGATLFGFLLTIITVIITFKKGFETENVQHEKTDIDPKEVPTTTVFDNVISKEQQFYGTPLYKKVLQVFINATYEIGIVLLILLILQFNIVPITQLLTSLISLGCLIMIIFSTSRSIYIFKLYLNVHIP